MTLKKGDLVTWLKHPRQTGWKFARVVLRGVGGIVEIERAMETIYVTQSKIVPADEVQASE